MNPSLVRLLSPRFLLALVFLLFQLYLLVEPLQNALAIPVHIGLSMLSVFAWMPCGSQPRHRVIDALMLAASAAVLAYYLVELPRLSDRM